VVAALCLFAPGCRFLHRDRAPKPIVIESVDLNTGSQRKIERLPGITPSMAKRIVEGRPYANPHDLVERDILTERELDRILDHVTVEKPR
jgi:DNA uptake protein ComE-like DNA-binding protein